MTWSQPEVTPEARLHAVSDGCTETLEPTAEVALPVTCIGALENEANPYRSGPLRATNDRKQGERNNETAAHEGLRRGLWTHPARSRSIVNAAPYGDCELGRQVSETRTPIPDGIGEGESLQLGFGSWTISQVRDSRFASPPHDGFAFIASPFQGDAKG